MLGRAGWVAGREVGGVVGLGVTAGPELGEPDWATGSYSSFKCIIRTRQGNLGKTTYN